jgi:hypothetical protein
MVFCPSNSCALLFTSLASTTSTQITSTRLAKIDPDPFAAKNDVTQRPEMPIHVWHRLRDELKILVIFPSSTRPADANAFKEKMLTSIQVRRGQPKPEPKGANTHPKDLILRIRRSPTWIRKPRPSLRLLHLLSKGFFLSESEDLGSEPKSVKLTHTYFWKWYILFGAYKSFMYVAYLGGSGNSRYT